MFTRQPRLTQSELERLSAFLDHSGQMNLEALDGFFCALVSGPELVPPSEYYKEIWNEDHTFADAPEATEILQLLTRHWNIIASALLDSLESGRPYLPILGEDENGQAYGNDWAEGFMHGVGMRPDGWNKFLDDEANADAIVPMLMLFFENHPDPERRSPEITPEIREELLDNMVLSLMNIYQHFAELRRGESSARLPSRRQVAKVGRNDRCPCGSGRKYKQCCGTTTTIH